MRETGAGAGALERAAPSTTDAIQLADLLFAGPAVLMAGSSAWHAQTSPSGGFQGGVVLASAFVMIYLAGEYLTFRRISPVEPPRLRSRPWAPGDCAGVGILGGHPGAAVPG